MIIVGIPHDRENYFMADGDLAFMLEQAGFLTFTAPEEPVDAVLSSIALHHLPDFWKGVALQRIADGERHPALSVKDDLPDDSFFFHNPQFSTKKGETGIWNEAADVFWSVRVILRPWIWASRTTTS